MADKGKERGRRARRAPHSPTVIHGRCRSCCSANSAEFADEVPPSHVSPVRATLLVARLAPLQRSVRQFSEPVAPGAAFKEEWSRGGKMRRNRTSFDHFVRTGEKCVWQMQGSDRSPVQTIFLEIITSTLSFTTRREAPAIPRSARTGHRASGRGRRRDRHRAAATCPWTSAIAPAGTSRPPPPARHRGG